MLEQDVIDYCIQIYKDNDYVSGYYQVFKPDVYGNMSDKVANQLMHECEKNIISDQHYAFILNFVSDEEFVKKLFPLILNNKAFEAIVSNKNLSEKLRMEALLESGSISVRNLTENMKRTLFDYYMEGIENISDDIYPANKMLSLCSEPNRFLTPELEIEAMKRLIKVSIERNYEKEQTGKEKERIREKKRGDSDPEEEREKRREEQSKWWSKFHHF